MTTLHQHPLAYLLGLEGVALMRAYAGEHDRAFTHARIEEVRALLDRAHELGDGVDLEPVGLAEGYDVWAPDYDTPDNPFFALDESVLLPILDSLEPGDAVDAMCGTGRYARHLADRGHRVRGYDLSPGMIALARQKVPDADFEVAEATDLPAGDASADVMVNALAVNHVEDLAAVFGEAARVLRPGGTFLLVSMAGYFVGSRLTPLLEHASDGRIGYLPEWNHSTGDYLRAALSAGFEVLACEDLVAEVSGEDDEDPSEAVDFSQPVGIWSLHGLVPAAAHAVRDDRPCLTVWRFRLP